MDQQQQSQEIDQKDSQVEQYDSQRYSQDQKNKQINHQKSKSNLIMSSKGNDDEQDDDQDELYDDLGDITSEKAIKTKKSVSIRKSQTMQDLQGLIGNQIQIDENDQQQGKNQNRNANTMIGTSDNSLKIKITKIFNNIERLKNEEPDIQENQNEHRYDRKRQTLVNMQAINEKQINNQPILSLVVITNEDCMYSDTFLKETIDASKNLKYCLELRDKYMFTEHQDYQYIRDLIYKNEDGKWKIDFSRIEIKNKKVDDYELYVEDGVFLVKVGGKDQQKPQPVIDFVDDIIQFLQNIHSQVDVSFCKQRLAILTEKFKMHLVYNMNKEIFQQRKVCSLDFYNTKKVDTHIHHSAAMTAPQLCSFIKKKIKTEGNTKVYKDKSGNIQTLNQVFKQLGLDQDSIGVEALEVQADHTIFQRFDNFNKKYNPMGQPLLREIFLKTDNYINGRFMAELTQEMMAELDNDLNCLFEWRISIYGKSMTEWKKLAQWVNKNKLYCNQVRWFIQVPRLYQIYKKIGIVKNFQDMLNNIFKPIFEVTLDPQKDPDLFELLLQVTGFDSVDDESSFEQIQFEELIKVPQDWNSNKNPPYIYWMYYFYANLYSLNMVRKQQGLNTFSFKPHCGESGNIDHLAACFMVSDGICHGIQLKTSPVLQYLYYLKRIPLAVSPLSNNKLFLEYSKNPFYEFFQRGLNVSLSTDDPLIIHMTKEPLMEEYAIASQVYNLSNVDLQEISNNSIKYSSFENILKEEWLGKNYYNTNNQQLTNLANIRYDYRIDTMKGELETINKYASN